VQRDEFSGGLRVTADELLDLEALRGRYAAHLRIANEWAADAKRLQQVLAPYRASGAARCWCDTKTALRRARSRSAMPGACDPTAACSPSSTPG